MNIINAIKGQLSGQTDQQRIIAAMSKDEWMELHDIRSKTGLSDKAFANAFWHLRIYNVVLSKIVYHEKHGVEPLWRLMRAI